MRSERPDARSVGIVILFGVCLILAFPGPLHYDLLAARDTVELSAAIALCDASW